MSTISRRALLGSSLAVAGFSAVRNLPGNRFHPLDRVGRENLKITQVKVTPLSFELPPDKQWMTGKQLIWKTDGILVEVSTDQGVTGIGEPTPYGGPDHVKEFIDKYVTPTLIGQNPFDLEHLTTLWLGTTRGQQAAWAGIDNALWDIIGKVKNLPVWKLLATDHPPQPHIRMYASGGVEYAWYKRPEALIEEAVRHKEEGYTAFKFRIGTDWQAAAMTVQNYIPYLRKMREAVGPNFDLIQESNMRLTLEQCLELCPVLEELKFLWFEEPVPTREPGAIEAYIRINQALKAVKVSGGESRYTRQEFKEWVDRDAYEIVQPDMNCTGITEGWHIARMAHLKGKICCPHNWHGGLTTMANAALVGAIPNRMMLELNQTFNPLKDEVFREPFVVRGGYLELPRKPGFGVELAPGLEKKFPYLPGHYAKPNSFLPA